VTIGVGDQVVANGLPGTVTAVQSFGTVTVYQVSVLNSQVRWFNANQFLSSPPIQVGSMVLVGTQPGTVDEVWPGGPYPLYLVRIDQAVLGWYSTSQLNPPLPNPPQPPQAGPTAGRIPERG